VEQAKRRCRNQAAAWYYSQIFADPKNADVVYAVNTSFFRSTDGGKKFDRIRNQHGDNHDLWIAPEDQNRFIESSDGGAQVTSTAERVGARKTISLLAVLPRGCGQ